MGWAILIIVIGWGVIGCAVQRKVLFPRWAIEAHSRPISESTLAKRGIERIWLGQAGDGVEMWLIKGDGVSAEKPGGVVIFAHGNGEVIDLWPGELKPYAEMGVSVLLVEFRGYGRSAGKPSESGIVADFVAAYDLIKQREDVDAEKMVVHGRSVGGGIAAGLVRQRQVRGVILESTFTSVKRMARRYLIPGFMVMDPMDVQGMLKAHQGEVLLMHGVDDGIIPAWHAKANADAAANAELILVEDAGHNDLPMDRVYWGHVRDYLVRVGVVGE